MRSHMGDEFLHHFIQNTAEYKELLNTDSEAKTDTASATATQVGMKNGAMERWQAYLLIPNLDQKQYGKITRDLAAQHVLNNDQYPKDTASAIMDQHAVSMPGMEEEVWLREEGFVNGLGFGNVADQSKKIVHHSKVEAVFTVTLKNGRTVRFQRNHKGLYTFKVPNTYKEAI